MMRRNILTKIFSSLKRYSDLHTIDNFENNCKSIYNDDILQYSNKRINYLNYKLSFSYTGLFLLLVCFAEVKLKLLYNLILFISCKHKKSVHFSRNWIIFHHNYTLHKYRDNYLIIVFSEVPCILKKWNQK